MSAEIHSEDGQDRIEFREPRWVVIWRGQDRSTHPTRKLARIAIHLLKKKYRGPKADKPRAPDRIDRLLEDAIGEVLDAEPPPKKPRALDAPMRRDDLICPDCKGRLFLRSGKFGLFYGCENFSKTLCRGSVSAYPNGAPMGDPVNQETRDARRRLAAALEHLGKDRKDASQRSLEYCQRTLKRLEAKHDGLTEYLDSRPDYRERTRLERLLGSHEAL